MCDLEKTVKTCKIYKYGLIVVYLNVTDVQGCRCYVEHQIKTVVCIVVPSDCMDSRMTLEVW